MIAWDALEVEIKNWLDDLGEKTEDDTAKFFSDSYIEAVTAGTDPKMNPAIIIPGKGDIIHQSWLASFDAQKASDVPLGPAGWAPVDSAIITFWTGTLFGFAIPHPPGVTGASNLVSFPGAPGAIASAIDVAFAQEESGPVASTLVEAYKTHAKSILGLWTGVTAAPSPHLAPWAGVK